MNVKNILASLSRIFLRWNSFWYSFEACFNFNLIIVRTSHCKRENYGVLKGIIIARHGTPTWWVACDLLHVHNLWIWWRGVRLSHELFFLMPKAELSFHYFLVSISQWENKEWVIQDFQKRGTPVSKFMFSDRNSSWTSDIVQLRKVFFSKDNLKINKNVQDFYQRNYKKLFLKNKMMWYMVKGTNFLFL